MKTAHWPLTRTVLVLLSWVLPAVVVAENTASLSATTPIKVTDNQGNVVVLTTAAKRIVSLSPHVTEMLFAAGAGQQVIAVVSYSDYPPAAKKLPQVGRYNAVDFERIIAMNPDLVVAWGSGNGSQAIEHLKRLGLTVYVSEPLGFADVAFNIEQLGLLSGHYFTAHQAASDFRQRLSALRQRYSSQTPLSVFYQIWDKPLITVNGEHLISIAISLCGGRNVFSGLPVLAPKVSLEAVLVANPDVIISGGLGRPGKEWHKRWLSWQVVTAVKERNLVTINPDWVQRQGPRIIDGAEQICSALQAIREQRSIAGGK